MMTYKLLGTIIFVFLIGIPYVINKELFPSIDAWVGFLGNYIGALFGGIIGALVAYFVAKIQINEMRDQEREKRYLGQSLAVAKIALQLNEIVKGYTLISDVKQSIPHPELASSNFEGLPGIQEEKWDVVSLFLDMKLQKDLLNAMQKYLVTYNSLMFDYDGFLQEIAEIENIPADTPQNILNQKIGRKSKLEMWINMARSNKAIAYSGVEENLKIANELKKKIDNLGDELSAKIK